MFSGNDAVDQEPGWSRSWSSPSVLQFVMLWGILAMSPFIPSYCVWLFPADMDTEATNVVQTNTVQKGWARILCNLELVNWKQIWSNPPWDGAAWCKRMTYGHVITRQHRLLWGDSTAVSSRASEMSVQECCGFSSKGHSLYSILWHGTSAACFWYKLPTQEHEFF